MTLIDDIQMDLDGVFVDVDPIGITCDFCPGPTVVDPTEPIQFEIIRFDEPSFLHAIDPPQVWTLDAVRCPWHADTRFPHATSGIDEALIKVEVEPVDDLDYRVRGETVSIIFHSPPESGQSSPILPRRMVEVAARDGDFGISRRSRAVTYIDALRAAGEEGLARKIDRFLTPGERLARQEGFVAPPPPDEYHRP